MPRPKKKKNNMEELSQQVFEAVTDAYLNPTEDMAKHFVGTGGCGIRSFLDMWVLNHCVDFNQEKRETLLADGGLTVFAKQAALLSEVWFGAAGHTEITRQLETYILRGGVYGTTTNRVAVQQQKRGGKVKYALSRILIPYKVIRFHYPILQKQDRKSVV